MSEIDPGLRDALRGLADEAPEGDDALWGATQRRIVQRRRRRTAMSVAGSGLTAVVIVAGVVAIARERDKVEVGESVTTTSTSVVSTPTTVTPPIRTNELVVATNVGTIEIVDDAWEPRVPDGVIATLPDRYIRKIAVSPQGDRVYYLVDRDPGPYGSDCADLYVVGKEIVPTLLAQTRSFALSPDGSRLALGAYRNDEGKCVAPDAGGRPTIQFRDASTGAMDDAFNITEPLSGQVESVVWNETPPYLTVKTCVAAACDLLTFDTESGELVPALLPEVVLDDQIVAAMWSDGVLRTLERCCEEDAATLLLRSRDAASGEVLEDVPILENLLGELDLVDIGGEIHLLAVDGTPGGVEARLYRLDGGEPVLVAEGFTAVAS